MEMEYRDPAKRGKFIVVVGVVLALAAGGAAFYLINQAQQQAGQGELQKTDVVVALAARSRPASRSSRTTSTVRQVPLDPTNADAIVIKTPEDVIGRVLSVTVPQGQMLTQNMLASAATGGQFSILEPGETVGPDSEAWRAVSITVPDDRAVGGMIQPGMTVDVLMSATVNVPQDLSTRGQVLHGQVDQDHLPEHGDPGPDRPVLHRQGARSPSPRRSPTCSASGNATFSMLMRPEAGRPERRRLEARRDDEPADRQVRPARAGELPARQRSAPDAAPDADRRRPRRRPRSHHRSPPARRASAPVSDPARPGQPRSPSARPWRLSRRAADPARLPGHPVRRRGPGGRTFSDGSVAAPRAVAIGSASCRRGLPTRARAASAGRSCR